MKLKNDPELLNDLPVICGQELAGKEGTLRMVIYDGGTALATAYVLAPEKPEPAHMYPATVDGELPAEVRNEHFAIAQALHGCQLAQADIEGQRGAVREQLAEAFDSALVDKARKLSKALHLLMMHEVSLRGDWMEGFYPQWEQANAALLIATEKRRDEAVAGIHAKMEGIGFDLADTLNRLGGHQSGNPVHFGTQALKAIVGSHPEIVRLNQRISDLDALRQALIDPAAQSHPATANQKRRNEIGETLQRERATHQQLAAIL